MRTCLSLFLAAWSVVAIAQEPGLPAPVAFAITAEILSPVPTPATPLLIDAVKAAPVGSLIYLEARSDDGKSCAWLCVPDTGNFRVVDTGNAAVFCSPTPGDWTFVACANSDGPVPSVASHTLTIGEPIPVPPGPIPPDPPVPPPTPAGPRWVLIFEESADRTQHPAVAAAIASTTLRDYLALNKHHPLRPVDQDSQSAWMKPYLARVKETGVPLPCLLIVRDPIGSETGAEILFLGPVPATVDAVIAELKRHGG